MAKASKEARERVAKLREAIDRYRHAYHVLDKEEIPAEALDANADPEPSRKHEPAV